MAKTKANMLKKDFFSVFPKNVPFLRNSMRLIRIFNSFRHMGIS